jgi:hypothetical protein
MHRLAFLLLLMAALVLALFSVSAPSAQSSSGKPLAPLAIANGNSVTLSWRLPVSPRPLNVVIYRGEVGGPLSRIGTVEAERRTFTDANVSAGQSYDYALAHDLRGQPLSAMSSPVSVSVGATDRIVFRGGSISRGVFDVTVYAENRKFVETFVAASGETVGDLRRVEGLEKALDFRLGCKVIALRLEIIAGKSATHEAAQDAAGNPLRDLGGRPIEITLPAKSEARERLVVEVEVGGRKLTLLEGEGFSP